MEINLSTKIAEHFERVEQMAIEAASDDEEKYSSRAAAMASVTTMLQQLTKAQAEVINMERLMRIEASTIETLREFLTPEQQERFLAVLEEKLANA